MRHDDNNNNNDHTRDDTPLTTDLTRLSPGVRGSLKADGLMNYLECMFLFAGHVICVGLVNVSCWWSSMSSKAEVKYVGGVVQPERVASFVSTAHSASWSISGTTWDEMSGEFVSQLILLIRLWVVHLVKFGYSRPRVSAAAPVGES